MRKAIETIRPRRTPIGQRQRLSVNKQEAGYVYRIVNDLDNRVPKMLEAGYEIVTDAEVGDKRVDVASPIGSSFSVGQGVSAVVMRQKREWYDEDQATKQMQVDQIEGTMKADVRQAADYGSITSEFK